MIYLSKFPSEKALNIITGPLSTELKIHNCNDADRSKAHLFELGGPGGRQFGLVVGDMYAAKNPRPSQQTRILLEKCELPEIPGVERCDDDYNGSRINQADSRIAPPNQSSCLVADETALINLVRWYAGSSAIPRAEGGETFGVLERARLEKAAQDAGFDLSVSSEGNWLIFRSTAFPQVVGISAQTDESYRVGLSDAGIGRQIAAEFRMDAVEATEPWATRFERVPDYQTLHRLLERIAAMWRVVAGSGLRNFEEKGSKLPNTTEAIRLAVQRVGQDIFRASLLEYWGGRCAVNGLDVPELLHASHIKPWADCASDAERLDVFNGLLLAPHLDALFDGGWVTFLSSGQMRISDELDVASWACLGISGTEVIPGLTDRHQAYLAWHRERCFRQGR